MHQTVVTCDGSSSRHLRWKVYNPAKCARWNVYIYCASNLWHAQAL